MSLISHAAMAYVLAASAASSQCGPGAFLAAVQERPAPDTPCWNAASASG